LDSWDAPAQHLPALRQLLLRVDRGSPGLNHLFQTAKTGARSEYTAIEETMAPAVLAIVTDRIRAHATR
jgi:hypothetical protein